eukprot:CAMPEP_0198153598 /NCGR_PEP_ID=MMETSP1443-20131203/64921_1 /TAXON_ID=186043 /ORGANISM="Entomoneis sp., Strain CCMP2396" /LENGTH=462 /DNA_ID=CAMNT_0043819995 /DNA_START=220 /DNA_END=1605 /DNA_ORIENTATION=-
MSTELLLSDEVKLGYALEAFAYAHDMGVGWATSKLLFVKSAGITNLSDLYLGCKEETINLDLELFGVPAEEKLNAQTIKRLNCFLPGPVGFRCFRLAQRGARKVKKGTADTEYVHRPENGKIGEEEWSLSNDEWVMKVDCAGFVRNCLKHVTKDPFLLSLSDRDFMRAKDFFQFFSQIPYTVRGDEEIPEEDRRMKWRKITDLRMIIPGDVICYRPRGNAAGGAAFTSTDRSDLTKLLKVVQTAQLWHGERSNWENLVTRNCAKDPKVKTWVNQVKTKLNAIGIRTVKQLFKNLGSLNSKLKSLDYMTLHQDTLNLMRECCRSLAVNTGHIVFASGPAIRMDTDSEYPTYRIRVVHSTKNGIKDPTTGEVSEGVQEHYRRFYLRPDGTWTREMSRAEPLLPEMKQVDESDDDPLDDMEDDPEDTEDSTAVAEDPGESTDDDQEDESVEEEELIVDVIAGRMC